MKQDDLLSILLNNSNIAAYLILSESGQVIETKLSERSAMSRLLKERSDFAGVFEIPNWQTVLKDVASGNPQGPFPVRKGYDLALNDPAYFSSYPDYSCRVLPLSANRILFLVFYKRRFYLPDNNESFCFDENNRIVAINQPFHMLLSKRFKDPYDVLGHSLDELFRETPRQLTCAAVRQQDGEAVEKQQWEWNGSLEGQELLFSHPEHVTLRNGCIHVTNSGKDFSIVTFAKEIDYSETRITFQIEYVSMSGAPPVIFFGTRGYPEDRILTPDASGFSLGPDMSNQTFILKRAGALMAAEPLNLVSTKKVHVLEISLYKNSIQCKVDDSSVFTFFTFNTYLNRRGYFNIGERAGRELTISKMAVKWEAIRNDEGPRSRDFLLEFSDLPGRFFSLSYLSSTVFNSTTKLCRVIELREVSDMQRRIIFEQENARRLHRKIKESSARTMDTGFIGSSEATRRLLKTADVLAKTKVTVLLQGLTGTGKEVLARHIHDNSDVFDQPFVKMDCSTLPRDLFESVVFGHAKGAFTGAIADAEGLLESAGNGTVFIDEIQNLSFAAQSKLLAVLQDRCAARLGDNKPRQIQARFIVGTNVDLNACIKAGTFRVDLFYRINQASLFLPALKDRLEDIPELCRHFIQQFNRENNSKVRELESGCLPILLKYSWPGNIRELKNVIYKSSIFSMDGMISEKLINESIHMPESSRIQSLMDADPTEDRITRLRLEAAMKQTNGRAVKAAKLLGISRSSIYYNLKRYGLSAQDFTL